MLSALSSKILNTLRKAFACIVDIPYDRRRCPLCGWTGREFQATGLTHKRRHGRCPRCGSLERHRLAYVSLADIVQQATQIIHVAPEHVVAAWLANKSDWYVSVDLAPRAGMQADLTRLPFRDSQFDLAYCSHVLEHIGDDMTAMTELFRVLIPGGSAIVLVPIGGRTTDEDLTITDPDERTRRFGQYDHVRLYGLDILDKLIDVGFQVDVIDASEMDNDRVRYHGLEYSTTRHIFVCKRPPLPNIQESRG